jgi:two-component system LytT family response regulator
MIHAILADDEVLGRRKLRQLLRGASEIEIAGECGTASETIELAKAINLDLIFLDIRMPGMDGFDILGELSASSAHPIPAVIFTTAFDSYALRAFEIYAVDYLLKPFTEVRLQKAVRRASEQIVHLRRGSSLGNGVEHKGHRCGARIVFKSRGRILFLPTSDIQWVGAEEIWIPQLGIE